MTSPAIKQLDDALAQMTAAVDAAKTELTKAKPRKWGFNATGSAQYQQQLGVFGQPATVRSYFRPGQKLAPITDIQRANFSWVLSGKVTPADVLAGKADADMTALAQWLQPIDLYCPWHEPEDDIEKGHYTLGDYQSMWDYVSALFRSVNPSVGLICILMGFTFTGGNNRVWQNYMPKDFDAIGCDTYAMGGPKVNGIGVGVQGIPTMFDPAAQAAQTLGKRFLVTETGVGRRGGLSGTGRTDAITAVAQAAVKANAETVCYFSQGLNDEWSLDTPAEQFAWKAAQQ